MSRWYWAVSCDNTVENPLVVDSADLGVDPEKLDIGEPVERWSDLAWLRAKAADNDGVPDDVVQNHLGLPVCSPRLRRALEKAAVQGIQYLPIRLFRPNGQEIAGFSVANVIERRRALDRRRSDYDVFPDDYFLSERRGKVRGLRTAVLNTEALAACDILRLDEFTTSIYVSERFREAFEIGGHTGYSFHEVALS
jgi:hypothetical protein